MARERGAVFHPDPFEACQMTHIGGGPCLGDRREGKKVILRRPVRRRGEAERDDFLYFVEWFDNAEWPKQLHVRPGSQ